MTEEKKTYTPSVADKLHWKIQQACRTFAERIDRDITDMVQQEFGQLSALRPFLADESGYRRAKAAKRMRYVELVSEDVGSHLRRLLEDNRE